MMAANETRRDSGIRLRPDFTEADALRAAQTVIARLEEEVARLGDALETQRSRYERTLQAERDERREVISTRSDRVLHLHAEIEMLREQNAALVGERDAAKWAQRRTSSALKQLREEHERTGKAYRDSLKALRRSFELQLDVA